MEIQNKFDIGDRVEILASGGIGYVTSIVIETSDHIRYLVEYADADDGITSTWMDDFVIMKKV